MNTKTQPVASEPSSGERARLVKALRDMAEIDFDDVFVKAAALLSSDAKPASEPNKSAYMAALEIRASQGWKLTGKAIPVLYTDTINGQQVMRDDVWLCTTDALRNESSEPVAVPQGYTCEIEEADFEANTITVKMLTNDYRIHAGEYRLSAAPSPAPVGIKKENHDI